MISDKDALEIIEGLLRKTKANEVNWQSDDEESEFGSFSVSFPESSVNIDFISPPAEPDYYSVSFFNKHEQKVKELLVEEGEAGWETVRDLFDEVGRMVLEWDKVLQDLKNVIQNPGEVGLKLNWG